MDIYLNHISNGLAETVKKIRKSFNNAEKKVEKPLYISGTKAHLQKYRVKEISIYEDATIYIPEMRNLLMIYKREGSPF